MSYLLALVHRIVLEIFSSITDKEIKPKTSSILKPPPGYVTPGSTLLPTPAAVNDHNDPEHFSELSPMATSISKPRDSGSRGGYEAINNKYISKNHDYSGCRKVQEEENTQDFTDWDKPIAETIQDSEEEEEASWSGNKKDGFRAITKPPGILSPFLDWIQSEVDWTYDMPLAELVYQRMSINQL